MLISKKNIADILVAHKKYKLVVRKLSFPCGTIFSAGAVKLAEGKIDLCVKDGVPSQMIANRKLQNYLVERARIAGKAGTGQAKKRGDSKYYSDLSKRKAKTNENNI